jgi:acyl-[acyl-carrier-protein] desaturase
LIKEWDIANIGSLTGAAEKARDYLMSLPERFKKVSERGLGAPVEYQFNCVKY